LYLYVSEHMICAVRVVQLDELATSAMRRLGEVDRILNIFLISKVSRGVRAKNYTTTETTKHNDKRWNQDKDKDKGAGTQVHI